MEVSEKQEGIMHRREADEEEQKRHYQSWETYWGRPGHGASRYLLGLAGSRRFQVPTGVGRVTAHPGTYWGRPGHGASRYLLG